MPIILYKLFILYPNSNLAVLYDIIPEVLAVPKISWVHTSDWHLWIFFPGQYFICYCLWWLTIFIPPSRKNHDLKMFNIFDLLWVLFIVLTNNESLFEISCWVLASHFPMVSKSLPWDYHFLVIYFGQFTSLL